jgi:DNA polymerase I-like protein with 3'-5' exonuclease and polymerase domains/RecA-family ATPase
MSDWRPPTELPDLRRVGVVALDTETKDDGLRDDRGSAWPWHGGYVCGVSVAYRADDGVRAHYFLLRHPDSDNFDPARVFDWLKDLVASDVRFVTQNGLYDWGWLRADGNVLMPPAERLEEIGALATLVDENRFSYRLDDLCAWRGLPGKDTTLLEEAVKAAGWAPRKRTVNVAEHIHKLPAHLVGQYAEADAVATLALFENLNPILDKEDTRDAYRLDVDLLPMVHEMRRRGIRIDQGASEYARDYCLQKRDAALAELSEKLGVSTGMDEIASPKWKADTFDAHKITYPRTAKGNPSFKAGKSGWMLTHEHWLPQLIAQANKYEAAGSKFLEGHILAHLVGGRVHAEINPHRSDNGGTRSFRFSYSNPPLQQMPSRDEELAPLIRNVFLPEEGEVWCKPDISQQEFRFVVHHALVRNLRGAKEAAARYCDDPDTDFHQLAAEITGIPRNAAKAANFAKIYGAGVKKFAEMIGKSLSEAQAIYEQYDRRLPFVPRLAQVCQAEAKRLGYTLLYDGARRHWDRWAPRVFTKGAGPCPYEEAKQRTTDPAHPWHRRFLHRADIHTALNALIQGSAARHTKLWMRACWREGVTPLLQMHDALDCSVTTREQGELVARLACEAVKLEVPMRVDLKFGKSWGDATHDAAAAEAQNDIPRDTEARAEPDYRVSDAPKASMSEQKAKECMNDKPANGGDSSYGKSKKQSGAKFEIAFTFHDAGGRDYQRELKYRNPDGTKYVPQEYFDGQRWVKEKPKGWIELPYALPDLIAAPPDVAVCVTEGPKDTETLRALSLVATTNACGAGKFTEEHAKWFTGKQYVYVFEDNDAEGSKHTAAVVRALTGIVPNIRVVRFLELQEHGDVSDWLALGHTKEELLERIKAAPEATPVICWVDMSRWDSEPMPVRRWAIAERVPANQVGIFSGEGGTGKSIIELMKDVAHVAPIEWYGVLPEQGPAFYVGAEDEEDEIRRRLGAIAEHNGLTFKQLIDGGLHVLCLLGKDATLCFANGKSGKIETTALYRQLYEAAGDIKPKNISIDTLTRAFAGSEIDRVQVHNFAMHMQALAMVTDGGAVTILSHPSLQGISSGTGLSGSTGWHNAFRFRQYLKGIKPEAGEQPDTDLRQLAFMKNQYGRLEDTITLRYQHGLFLPEEGMIFDQAVRAAKAEEVFIELLRRFTSENRYVGDKPSVSYAPALFAGEDAARKAAVTKDDLAKAMRRLFAAGKIWNEPYGRHSRPSYRIAMKG